MIPGKNLSARVLAASTVAILVTGIGLAAPAQAVAAKSTKTTVSVGKAVVGSKVTVAAVTSPMVTGGTMQFTVSGKTLKSCSKVAVAAGKASCTTTFTTAGTRTIVAKYSGKTPTYKASSGSKVVTVAAKPTASPIVVGSTGACTTSTGALVAVSYGPWGGPVARGCSTSLSTGRALLTRAGFTLSNVLRLPGFICRIGSPLYASGTQYPKPSQDPCVNTPPTSAYWSFWTAAKGATTWTYSSKGADSDTPVNGEVEAWTFGKTDIGGTTGKPTFTPSQVRAGLPAARAQAASNLRVANLAAPGATPDLGRALDYLVEQLTGGNHYEQFGQPDLGLTMDAAYALAASGARDNVLADVTDYVAAHENDFTLLEGQYAEYASGGGVAKVALLAEMTGREPRTFGGADLIAGLKRLTCATSDVTACAAKGNYAWTSSVFGQALGVIAQLRAGAISDAAAPIAYLEGLQTKAGGFPSLIPSSGAPAETDSTAIAAMALALVPGAKARTALAAALKWLAGQQNSDGGFPGASGDSVNSAALAAQALHLDAETYTDEIGRAQRFLASTQNLDGGFDIAAGADGSDVRASAQAAGGAIGTPFASVLDDLGAKADAARGADYLVQQLVGGNHYTGSYQDGAATITFDDQGLTADGVFALLAAGGHQESVDAMVAYLKEQVDAYADPTGSMGGPYSGSLAKLALIAEATGNDPHDFGGTDLLGILKNTVCPKAIAGPYSSCTAPGDFYSAYSEISQTLGILALQASSVGADHLSFSSAPVVRLRQLQCADGGFASTLNTGNAPCTSEVDATGFAIQALATVPDSDAVLGKAQHYLEKVQRPSGLYNGAAGDNSNSTALAGVGLQTLVTALVSTTVDPPGPKTTTPITAWQSALAGLRSLAVRGGGFGLTDPAAPDLRASAQAVLAAAQRTLISLSGAAIAATPRDAAVVGPGRPTPPTGTTGTPAGTTPGGSPAPDGGSSTPIEAGGTADTGAPTGQLLLWSTVLLLLGGALAFAGRRRIAVIVGRHRAATHSR